MRIITAVEEYQTAEDEVKVFLAGGITNCPDWQKEVIDNLKKYDAKYPGELDKLVVFNPRRPNFPIGDPNASREQITWEFNALNEMDIFSMFFTDGPSDQPICMYELGRNILRMQVLNPANYDHRIVISCDPKYKRFEDVKIQTELAWTAYFGWRVSPRDQYEKPDLIEKADPMEHMYHILRAYKWVKDFKAEQSAKKSS